MRFLLPAALTFSLALTTITPVAAQRDLKAYLQPDQVKRLSPEAAVFYHRAEAEADHINYDEAIKLLSKAAEIDTKNIELQFLTASHARNRADVYYGEATYSPVPPNMDYSSPPWKTAEQYLNMSETALNRIAINPDLPAEQRTRLGDAQANVEARRNALNERDKARLETGLIITDYYRETRYEALLRELPDNERIETDEASERIARAMGLAGVKVKNAKGQIITAPAPPDNSTKVDPFGILPGEFIQSFLPPPPPPPGQQNLGQQPGGPIDPFASPQPAPVDGGGAPADGGNPPPDPSIGSK